MRSSADRDAVEAGDYPDAVPNPGPITDDPNAHLPVRYILNEGLERLADRIQALENWTLNNTAYSLTDRVVKLEEAEKKTSPWRAFSDLQQKFNHYTKKVDEVDRIAMRNIEQLREFSRESRKMILELGQVVADKEIGPDMCATLIRIAKDVEDIYRRTFRIASDLEEVSTKVGFNGDKLDLLVASKDDHAGAEDQQR